MDEMAKYRQQSKQPKSAQHHIVRLNCKLFNVLRGFSVRLHSTCDFCIRCGETLSKSIKINEHRKKVIICRRQLIIFIVIAFVWSHHRIIKSKGICIYKHNEKKKPRHTLLFYINAILQLLLLSSYFFDVCRFCVQFIWIVLMNFMLLLRFIPLNSGASFKRRLYT